MKRTVFQHPELRDANDNIIQQGAFGKNTALANATNDGWIDYVANDLEALHDNINGARIYVASKAKLPATGDLSAMYIAEDTGKWYVWNGTTYIESDDARKIADEAIAARDAAKASANDAANSAREQQADWAVTDTTSKAFIKNKPGNLINIGNYKAFNLDTFLKNDNGGNPVYFLMHELVQYNPDKQTIPISAVYGFNGKVFSEPRVGNGGSQFLAIVKVGLGYEYNGLYSSSSHYTPVVLKDETNNKYYWAMEIKGSYQRVYMMGTFTATPLNTVISAVDIAGTLPEGWSLVHTAKPYPFDNTHVASADKDGQGNTIDTTYLKKSDAATSLTTNTLTATDATFTGTTSVPTANAGNSSKAIANTEFVQGELTNYLPLSGGSITGDVDITGDLSVSGAITGNVLTYKKGAYKEVLEWEDNCMQAVAEALATDHPDAYNYGLQVTLGKIGQNGGASAKLYFPHNDGLYLKNTFNGANSSGWIRMLDTKNFSLYALPKNGIAVKATADAAGNNIQNTYVKKSDLIGSIQAFAGNSLPTGWLLCDGSAVSRTDYAALFAVIGTTYGAGNGSTTFNLPNLVDKFVEGSATAGTVKSAGLPNITGTFQTRYPWNGAADAATGAFKSPPTTSEATYTQESSNTPLNYNTVSFNANKSNSVYGNSTTVQPPALTMRYIIKY